MIRTVELTDNSVEIVDTVKIDGRPWLNAVDAGTDRPFVLTILYSGPAEVSGVPLDGIERLRERLRQP